MIKYIEGTQQKIKLMFQMNVFDNTIWIVFYWHPTLALTRNVEKALYIYSVSQGNLNFTACILVSECLH